MLPFSGLVFEESKETFQEIINEHLNADKNLNELLEQVPDSPEARDVIENRIRLNQKWMEEEYTRAEEAGFNLREQSIETQEDTQQQPAQPATKQPWQQGRKEFVDKYGDVVDTESRDSSKLGEEQVDEYGEGIEGDTTDITPSRGFSLPDNTENV